jgi:hypothetical protein
VRPPKIESLVGCWMDVTSASLEWRQVALSRGGHRGEVVGPVGRGLRWRGASEGAAVATA